MAQDVNGPASTAAVQARAESFLAVGRSHDAVEVLLAAGAPHLGPARLAFLLAQAHLGEDQPDLARGAAELGLGRAPESEWGLRLRAVALSRLGRHGAAIDSALAATHSRPDLAATHVTLGSVCLSAHQARSAVVPAETALALAPNDPDVHVLAGRVALARRRTGVARRHFIDALALDPEHAVARNNVGITDLRRFRAGQAKDHFVGSARLDPRGPGADNVAIVAKARRGYLVLVGMFAIVLVSSIQDHDLIGLPVIVAAIIAWRTDLLGRIYDRVRPPQPPKPTGLGTGGPWANGGTSG